MSNELVKKSNEELCAIVARLKQSLLEARFKMATGEIEKLHMISQVRKSIAQVLTELRKRNLKVTIGSHGIYLHDMTNNSTKTIKDSDIQALVEKAQEKAKPAKQEETKKPAKKATKATETSKEGK